ncbi:hypothetical protein DMA11_05395 [Marinilabiliaceae bacterium JC017]|nr:hypothetical protein DMA11_05395 [Marinilabiliaceae bacterium JC017]
MIFTGIEILFFTLGLLTALFIVALVKYNKELNFDKWSWITLITGGSLALFCIAWSVSSVLEGVPRASSMGMVVFGIPSIVLLLLGRRMAIKKK